MPKISVIVPVYNAEKYLTKCFDSILNQTFQDFEIIIINDGSTDNSEKIILDFTNKYSNKIKYIKQKNQGIANTRNIAIQEVSSDYFLFVDSDDFIDKEVLEKLYNAVSKEDIDIVKYKMIVVKENSTEKINGPIFNKKNGNEAFNELCFTDKMIDTPCLYLFNTEFYKKNNFKFLENTYHEDFGLIPLIILKANSVTSIDFCGYNYVQADNSITRNEDYEKTLKKANDLLIHYDNMINYLKNMKTDSKTKENIKQYYTIAILHAYKEIKKNDQKVYINEIKKRKLLKNMKIKNLRSIIKKILFLIHIDVY